MRICSHCALGFALALYVGLAEAAPPKSAQPLVGGRPVTFANTVAFFRKALGRAPLKADARIALFAEGEWTNPNVYNHSAIFIENADEDMEVTFMMSGDEGMNWVTEFFDSPFFTRRETEAFFQLFHSGLGTRRKNVGRFKVEMSRWRPHHHEIVVLSLTPSTRPGRASAGPAAR